MLDKNSKQILNTMFAITAELKLFYQSYQTFENFVKTF